MERIDRTGERFGRLEVEEMLYGYKNKMTYAKCICDCGNETIVCVKNLIGGRTKSCGCLEKISRYGRKHHEKDISGSRYGHLTVIEATDRRASNGAVVWKCLCDCGNTVFITSSHLLRGKTRSCGCGKTSKYEEIVCDILDKIKEPYIREYIFADCKNTYPLRFDFYLPNRNICIECNGQQHYHPVDFFGGETRHKTVLHNDAIKKQYCNNNKIVLVCLPYTLSEQEIETELLSILNPCND